MTETTPECPDQASLEAVMNGRCSGEALAAIEQHIEECPHCQARLESSHVSWKQLLPASGRLDLARSQPSDSSRLLADRRLGLPGRATTPLPAADHRGQTIGHYQLIEQIARGGMGVVYRATDSRLGRDVAIKLLSGDRVDDANWLERFHREARITGALNHPNIVTIFEIGTHEGTPYLATEFVEGSTLRHLIREGHRDLEKSLAWAVQMADGLKAAHQAGIIHRDFKPENVMIRRDDLVKILDFGLARPTESSPESAEQSLSSSGLLIGTVSYMSPEQARGLRVGVESDVFSFATVLYFMLTGSRPFPGKTPSDVSAALLTRAPRPTAELGVRLPAALQKLLMRCFSKTPELRPAASELCEKLRDIAGAVIASEPATALSPTTSPMNLPDVSPGATIATDSGPLSSSIAATAGPPKDVAGELTQVTGLSDTTVPTRSALEPGPIRYARSGDVNIAWQEIGSGPIDLVFVMGWVSHLEWFWKHPTFAAFLRRLASFSRVILFDKRGTGLSDKVPVNELPNLETRMDDVRAVMDAAGSERAVLCGVSEGGPLCTLYAATYPQKTIAIVMMGCYARRLWADDYPWGPRPEQRQVFLDDIRDNWGGPLGIEDRAPSLAADPGFRDWWASYLRMGASPGAAVALTKMNAEIDVRPILPTIQVPTLVLHRTGDRCLLVEEGRHLASLVTGARFVELPGDDHLPFVGDADGMLDEIEEFLTGKRHAPVVDRVLATVLQLSIETGGDTSEKTQQLIEQFQTLVQRQSELFRGENFQSVGSVMMMTFDGPARAVRAANAVCGLAFRLKLDIRCGLDTGPCDIGPHGVSGPAVESAGRIAAAAAIQSILISEVVYHLVSGSGLEFIENTSLGCTRKTFQLIR